MMKKNCWEGVKKNRIGRFGNEGKRRSKAKQWVPTEEGNPIIVLNTVQKNRYESL